MSMYPETWFGETRILRYDIRTIFFVKTSCFTKDRTVHRTHKYYELDDSQDEPNSD